MEMPIIKECDADECAYNTGRQCHAMAITVGDLEHAMCDTYTQGSMKAGDPSMTGCVGACKMSGCTHNMSLQCSAPGITVGTHLPNDFDCMTYTT